MNGLRKTGGELADVLRERVRMLAHLLTERKVVEPLGAARHERAAR